MDRRKKAKRGGERKHGEEIGFRLSALIEGVRDSITPSAPALTISRNSRRLGGAPESLRDPSGLQHTQVPSHWHAKSEQHGLSRPF
jgi:hypothetical protein